MESEMTKKILIIFTVFMLIVMGTTPALANKPTEPKGKGNPTHENQSNPNPGTNRANDRSPADPGVNQGNIPTTNTGIEVKTTKSDTHGFDQYGYNDTARIFNGTYLSWCEAKGLDCEDSPNANDRLIMKWNAEWDRGNAEGWDNPPYAAWENNEWNGKVPGGSGDVWHYKIVWVGTCTEGSILPNGGYCIWGQFEVLMDQGTSDGVHEMLTHAIPNGYGSYK